MQNKHICLRNPKLHQNGVFFCRRDGIVVSTLRCGRNNPGSNPDHGKESI